MSPPTSTLAWCEVRNSDEIPSPALVLHLDRVEHNLQRMLEVAIEPARLRPHLKTHKLAELVRRQIELGIDKFKCATIAEAEMALNVGATDVLLAYQPVGPHIARFVELAASRPKARLSCLVDCEAIAHALSRAGLNAGITVEVLLDLDTGQHRTGVPPGPGALDLYRLVASLPGLRPGGLHAYDGHIHDRDPWARAAHCAAGFAPVEELRASLRRAGMAVPRLVTGGTPTFPIHAQRDDVECSPGTCVLWDAGYAKNFPDLPFLTAAVLLTRVVSKPTLDCLCLDLGHKAVAAEMPPPRVEFPNLPDAVAVAHNEEHLVVRTARAADHRVGDCFYAIPWHVCPTVALHQEVWVAEQGLARTRWEVIARARRLSI